MKGNGEGMEALRDAVTQLAMKSKLRAGAMSSWHTLERNVQGRAKRISVPPILFAPAAAGMSKRTKSAAELHVSA